MAKKPSRVEKITEDGFLKVKEGRKTYQITLASKVGVSRKWRDKPSATPCSTCSWNQLGQLGLFGEPVQSCMSDQHILRHFDGTTIKQCPHYMLKTEIIVLGRRK